MEKYVLITVIDREMSHEVFEARENAQNALELAFYETLGCEKDSPEYEEITEESDCCISEDRDSAWINDGPNSADYDWQIITV